MGRRRDRYLEKLVHLVTPFVGLFERPEPPPQIEKKNPPNAASMATVTASRARMPACVALVCAEFGLPKHTGHARAGFAAASSATVVTAIPMLFLIPNP